MAGDAWQVMAGDGRRWMVGDGRLRAKLGLGGCAKAPCSCVAAHKLNM